MIPTFPSLGVMITLLVSSAATAQSVSWILLASHDGPADHVVIVDDNAYIAGGQTLRIVDISNPSAPVEWSSFAAADQIYGLHADGQYVYLAVGLEGVQIINVSSPMTPRLVATHLTPGQAVDVATVGSSALVVNLMTGLEVVDLSTPRIPRLLVTQDTPGYQRAVSADGVHVFVVDQPTGVVLFDLSAPERPVELGTHPSGEAPARTVATDATDPDRVYVVYERTGLVEVIDISDPGTPRLIGSYSSEGRPQYVTVFESTVYIPKGQGGIEAVDMTDPTSPTVQAIYDTPGDARMISVTNSLIAVADGEALLLLRRP